VVAARGGDVLHPFNTVDRLLERHGNGRFDSLCARSRVEGGHLHRGRRELGELRDRQRRDADQTRNDDDERADAGENWTADEGLGEHETDPGYGSARRWSAAPAVLGARGGPSARFCAPQLATPPPPL